MKIQIDLKSALCGLVIGAVAMFAIGAGESSNLSGRYQLSAGQNLTAIVDTQTGKVWAYDKDGQSYYPPGTKNGNFWGAKGQ